MLTFPKLPQVEYSVATIKAYGPMTDEGTHLIEETKTVTGYFEQETKVITNERGQNPISASLFIVYEDIPSLNSEDKGEALINGKNYNIASVARFFNFTNTVHHIELLVI